MKWKIIVCMGAMKKKLMKKTMRITQLVVGQTDSSAAPQCLMVSHIKISLNNVSVLCCAVLWLLLPLLLHLIKIHSTDCFLSFHFVHIVWQQHHHHHHHDHDHDHDHISSAQLERNLVHRISQVEDLNEKSQQRQQQQQNHGKFPLPLSHTTQKLNCERKCWYFFSFI